MFAHTYCRPGSSARAFPSPTATRGASQRYSATLDNISRYAITGRVSKTRDPHSLLPLTPAMLHVLLAVADGDKHGYAIIKEVARRTNGDVALGAGTLYALIKRLLAEGMILETDDRPDPSLDDERRRYYRLTPFGRSVAMAEIERLQAIVEQAHAKRLFAPAGKRARA